MNFWFLQVRVFLERIKGEFIGFNGKLVTDLLFFKQ